MKVLLLYIFSKNISIESDYLKTKMSNFDIRIEQNIRKILTVFFVIICTIKEKILTIPPNKNLLLPGEICCLNDLIQ